MMSCDFHHSSENGQERVKPRTEVVQSGVSATVCLQIAYARKRYHVVPFLLAICCGLEEIFYRLANLFWVDNACGG